MIIKSYASSSAGNAYMISDGQTTLLIECGLPYKQLNRMTGYALATFDACLVSHQHLDHANCAADIMKNGIDLYCGEETAAALHLSGHRLHNIEHDKNIKIGTLTVKPLIVAHDVECYSFLIKSEITNEQLYFAIDTHYLKYAPSGLHYAILEVNYQQEILDANVASGYTEYNIGKRIMASHMELQAAVDWLKKIDKKELCWIYVAHLSAANANAQEVKTAIQKIAGVPVTIFAE